MKPANLTIYVNIIFIFTYIDRCFCICMGPVSHKSIVLFSHTLYALSRTHTVENIWLFIFISINEKDILSWKKSKLRCEMFFPLLKKILTVKNKLDLVKKSTFKHHAAACWNAINCPRCNQGVIFAIWCRSYFRITTCIFLSQRLTFLLQQDGHDFVTQQV